MDAFGYLVLVSSSILANITVVGMLGSFIVMAAGTLLIPLNRRHAINMLAGGGILCGAIIVLAAVQLGAVPVSFAAVARLGLFTFPPGPVVDTYAAVMTFILRAAGTISTLCLLVGFAILVGSKGNSGFQLLLTGAVMEGLGGLVGGGGIVLLIMHYLGVVAPVLA